MTYLSHTLQLSGNFDKYFQKFFPSGKGELMKITNSSAPGLQEILVGIGEYTRLLFLNKTYT